MTSSSFGKYKSMILNKNFLRKLASLRLAIGLLFLIGILISIGTVIEQDQPLTFYKNNYPDQSPLFGFFTWRLIIYLGLDHLYSAFWFLSILVLFAFSLLSCTFTTQLPALKNFRLWQFLDRFKKLERLSVSKQLKRNNLNTATYNIYKDNYHLFRQGRKNYAYSGLLGRVGPIIVHFSIMILILGTSWSALSGYNIQEIIPRGEITHLQNLVKRGPNSYLSNNGVLRINDFWITYTPESKINQFYSDVSILNETGSETLRKTIFVNEPLQFKGLTIYQTDWDLIGLKFSLNEGRDIQIPLKKITKSGGKFWLGSIKVDELSNQQFTVLCNDLNGYIYLYNQKGALIKNLSIGESLNLTAVNSLKFKNFITSTGLQIKEDPGIVTVYVAFLLLMVSIYVSFFSYSQIWSVEQNQLFLIGGKSNRAVLDFQETFKKYLKMLK